jgi:hypothetical protein
VLLSFNVSFLGDPTRTLHELASLLVSTLHYCLHCSQSFL